jgi:hypothetical protein
LASSATFPSIVLQATPDARATAPSSACGSGPQAVEALGQLRKTSPPESMAIPSPSVSA